MTPATPERGTDLTRVLAEAPCLSGKPECGLHEPRQRGITGVKHPECALAALTAHLREHGALLDETGRMHNDEILDDHSHEACHLALDPKES